MQLKYGSYSFDANSVEIKSDLQFKINAGGQPYAQVQTLDVSGYLAADGQAAISTAMSALATALATPYQDLVFYNDAGAATATALTNATSISGVKITRGPVFPKNMGAEFATQRYFEFSAMAEYPLANTSNFLMDYSERLTFSGGGPVWRFKLALNGRPQKQLIYPASVFRATQRGKAVGYLKVPRVSAPIWPAALTNAPGDFEQAAPTRKGNGYEGFEISWAYTFESASPLVGVPNYWIS